MRLAVSRRLSGRRRCGPSVSLLAKPLRTLNHNPPAVCRLSLKGSHIENHTLAPIVITGGAALAAIIALSRPTPTKSSPPTIPPSFPKFTNQNITSHFIAAIPELTSELNLELATATQTETFTRSSERVLLGFIDLGTSAVQIHVPVTYRYHICLREVWQLVMDGRRVIVQAPTIRPSLPPAIHTDKLEKLAVRGWCRGSPDELMEQMQREITPTLIQHAGEAKHLDLVRPQCRQSVAEFVRLWLEREGQWGRHYNEIEVRFPGELTTSQTRRLKQ